jgi:hypothetical protein
MIKHTAKNQILISIQNSNKDKRVKPKDAVKSLKVMKDLTVE